jgi:pimeloyl-ACP methyl ester carboxylesterase
MADPEFLARDGGERLAFRRLAGRAPGIVWLGGFRSDMDGNKASALHAWAQRMGHACLRFDYFGHGLSSGDFEKGTISRWRDDALAVLDTLTTGPQILVGSSMGGWIAALAGRARRARIAGMVLIAPAPDFTEALMWRQMSAEAQAALLRDGIWQHRSEIAEENFPITRALIEDGRSNLVLDTALEFPFPVRILQGMADPDVPWQHALKLAEAIRGDVTATLVKAGDHRLSTPADLKLLERTLAGLIEDIS